MTDPTPRHSRIEFIDLARQQERIRKPLERALACVLDHGHYIMGPEVEELERRLAAFCGARNVVTCANGTDALILALKAMGLTPGQGVIVPSFTFCATAEAVCALGGIPLFADVREDTFNLDPRSLKEAIATALEHGPPIAGVIAVDLFGQPCDYDAIEPVVRESGLWLVCDAAQAFGAGYRGRPVGTIGDIATTSFFPAKPLGCYGDGGAVFTRDDHAAEIVRSLRVHGQGRNKYDNVRIGMNSRLDTLQAAILLEKLAVFPDELEARSAAAGRYAALLPPGVEAPAVVPGATSTWAQYTIRTRSRAPALRRLQESGIPAALYYARPLHRQDAYGHYPTVRGGLPATERLAETVLSLPMHPYLTADAQRLIVQVLDDGRPAALRGAAD